MFALFIGSRDRCRARRVRRDFRGAAALLHAVPPASLRPREDVQRLHGDLAVLLVAAARPEHARTLRLD